MNAVVGREEGKSLELARLAQIDVNPTGLKVVAWEGQKDINTLVYGHLNHDSTTASGEKSETPRYVDYSVCV